MESIKKRIDLLREREALRFSQLGVQPVLPTTAVVERARVRLGYQAGSALLADRLVIAEEALKEIAILDKGMGLTSGIAEEALAEILRDLPELDGGGEK